MNTRRWVLTRCSAAAAAVCMPWVVTGCKTARPVTGGFKGSSPAHGHRLRELPAHTPASTSSNAPSSTTPATTRRVHTLIAGGGVAGLSAARALRLQGMDDFALLELEDTAGGNARAGQIAGIIHPLGAHYLPVPGDSAPEVQDFLEELGLRQRISGRWQYDERHLCHSPQERLFFNGAWQDGLLPLQGILPGTLAQYGQFARLVARWRSTGFFQIPLENKPKALLDIALLAIPFIAYLDSQGLTDPHLRWYLDYCCRDDYGAGMARVSAWAGIHYFAARHGFQVPGHSDAEPRDGVLTWPEGNARLSQALARPLGDRLHTARLVQRIDEGPGGVTVDALNVQTRTVERWQAQRCIVALPVFIAARVVTPAPAFLQAAARHTTYASWLVANIHTDAPLQDALGAPPSWDNVLYGQQGLGYVDAMHQSTRSAPGPTVLTYYKALGTTLQARRDLLDTPWTQQRDAALAEMAVAHPDIYQRAVQVDITRYGHAMAVPTPAFTQEYMLKPSSILPTQLLKSEHSKFPRKLHYAPRATPHTGRLAFAHSDWSGYSVLEEAFTRGLHAGLL